MLRGERVLLRPKTRHDLPRQHEMDHDLALALLAEDRPPIPRALEQLETEFDRQLADPAVAWFAIEADGRFIGRCGLHAFHETDRTCQLGIVIGDPDYWGRGYGREAIGLLLVYAFCCRNMRKVCLKTGSHNARALRCYHACGFVEEGRLRQQQWCNGEYIDHVYMGILRDEWRRSCTLPLVALPPQHRP